MSFDLFFQPCRFADCASEKSNPVTGETQTILHNENLQDAELEAVNAALKDANAFGPDQFGCYVVSFEDGGRAEIFGRKINEGCMVSVRGLTHQLVEFFFKLLHAGKWTMCPAMEDVVAITTSEGILKNIPEDFPKIVICDSPSDLRALLTDGVQAWQKYRDKVIGNE